MSLLRIVAVLFVLALVGCGSEPQPIAVTPPAQTPAAQNAKTMLQEIADTGERGSGMEMLRQNLEQIKQGDEAKGSGLLSELDALEKASDTAAVKAKAKAMADKL